MKIQFKNREPIIIFISTLIFYSIQLPSTTPNADVIAFSIRSLCEAPIFDFAYLESRTLVTHTALPNYHLGHTLIMWLFYQIIPNVFDSIIIISGLVSALSGSLVVVLTYLIWIKLGFTKRESVVTSVFFALIPSFWELATLGEIHSLQMLFILLFVYAFINNKIMYATIAFLIANLITPLSGLSFGLIFLGGFSKQIVKKSLIIGSVSLLLYSLIFYLIGADFSIIFNEALNQSQNRGLIYRISILIFFILININVFSFSLLSGFKQLHSKKPKLLYLLIIGTIPQLLLLFVGSAFFIEKGSFQIPIFWAIALPIGMSLSKINFGSVKFITAAIIFLSVAIGIWFYPHLEMSKSYNDAGIWLKQSDHQEISIIGPWTVSIPIISLRNGNDLDSLNHYYYDFPAPSDTELMQTGKQKLIISDYNKTFLRQKLSNLGIPGLTIKKYNPLESINIGKVNQIFKNKYVTLYLWEK